MLILWKEKNRRTGNLRDLFKVIRTPAAGIIIIYWEHSMPIL